MIKIRGTERFKYTGLIPQSDWDVIAESMSNDVFAAARKNTNDVISDHTRPLWWKMKEEMDVS